MTEESFTRVAKIDGEVQAFLALNEEAAIAKAEKLDKQPMDNRGPLFGLPIGLKDNIVTKGIVTTCASRMLENFTPVYNATVVDKLNEAGMVQYRETEYGRVRDGFVNRIINLQDNT